MACAPAGCEPSFVPAAALRTFAVFIVDTDCPIVNMPGGVGVGVGVGGGVGVGVGVGAGGGGGGGGGGGVEPVAARLSSATQPSTPVVKLRFHQVYVVPESAAEVGPPTTIAAAPAVC